MLSGYLQINLNNNNLASSGSSIKVEGIYDALEGNYGKAILLGGLTIGEVDYPSIWANCSVVNTDEYSLSFLLGTSSYVLVIDDTDNVQLTITNLQ